MKVLVGSFKKEKALVEAFSVIVKLREGSFPALLHTIDGITISPDRIVNWCRVDLY